MVRFNGNLARLIYKGEDLMRVFIGSREKAVAYCEYLNFNTDNSNYHLGDESFPCYEEEIEGEKDYSIEVGFADEEKEPDDSEYTTSTLCSQLKKMNIELEIIVKKRKRE